jgi:LAS seventeen-binding protein 1/2
MSPQDPENAALLAHIVSQIEHNVNFLASQNYISNGDASAILTRLPNTNQNEITSRAANLNIGSRNIPPPPIPRSTPAPPTATLSRALWAYNENGEVFLTYVSFIDFILKDPSRIPTICLLLQEIQSKS